MKIITGSVLFFFFYITCLPQEISFAERFDFGVFGGTSYYTGDINSYTPFYSPGISYGALIVYNFNERYAIKSSFFRGNISGNDMDFNYSYQSQIRQHSFNCSFVEGSIQLEFNFLPFLNLTTFKYNYSFYTTAGIGYTFIMNSNTNANNHLTLPFGCGFKYNAFERFNVGVEWTYNKTFNDRVDGIVNPTNSEYHSTMNNSDWYSFAGVFITYKLFHFPGNCPTWEEK